MRKFRQKKQVEKYPISLTLIVTNTNLIVKDLKKVALENKVVTVEQILDSLDNSKKGSKPF